MRGILITLEGIDGSGKTTALRIISSKLAMALPKRHFVLAAEPTSSEAGNILRNAHISGIQESQTEEISKARRMEELFLFLADHANHLAEAVIPALDEGAVVISDRYTDSTAAYQGVTLRGIVSDPVNWIRNLCNPWNILPDLTILFALDPALALQRIKSRPNLRDGLDKFERELFLREVDGNFRLLAKAEPERFRIIDASKGCEDVANEALVAIIDRLSFPS